MSLTPDQRRYIVALRETGMSVAGIAKRFGITRRTVYLWTRRFEKEGNVNRQQTTPRKRATTEALDAEIRAALAAEPGADTRQLALRFNVSMATIRQRMYGDRRRAKVEKDKEESFSMNACMRLVKAELASTSETSEDLSMPNHRQYIEEEKRRSASGSDKIKSESEQERSVDDDSGEEVANRFVQVEVKMEKEQNWQQGVCRCCLSQGEFELMERENNWGEHTASYVDILKTCLGLTLARIRGQSRICSECSDQLLQALTFRRQVMESERVFLSRESTEVLSDIPCSASSNVEATYTPTKSDSEISPGITGRIESEREDSRSSDDDIPFNTIPPAKPKRIRPKRFITPELPLNTTLPKFVPTIRTFECKVCKETFETYRMKYHHTKEAHGSQCKICYKRFLNMKEHMEEHEASAVKCELCEMSFYKLSELTNHKRTVHNVQKAASCPYCNYVAFDQTCLKKHMVCHSNDKNYECRHCSKRFARKTGLKNHERLHTGEKQYVCELCGEAFTQCTSLKYHMHKRHPDDIQGRYKPLHRASAK